MSTLKVDTILKRTGTGTITVGQSGDTISIPSGATLSNQGTTVPTAFGKIGQVVTVHTENFNFDTTSTSYVTTVAIDKSYLDDLTMALKTLGYSKDEIKRAISKSQQVLSSKDPIQTSIKHILKHI